jgi:LEA14-like dessication related protein
MKMNLKMIDRKTISWGVLTCTLLLMFMGCKAYDAFKEPALSPIKIEKADVILVNQSDEAAKFDVVLTVNNPNKTPLPLVSSSINLALTGHGGASANTLHHRTVPANGTQTVTISIVILTTEKVTAKTDYSVKGELRYQPPGEFRKLLTDSKVPLPAAAFSFQGQM